MKPKIIGDHNTSHKKILIVGPSETKVPGGIATVISGMRNSKILNDTFQVDVFASCINGPILLRLAYTAIAYFKFLFCVHRYDLFHLHVASYGSTFRKMLYVKAIRLANKKVILHLHSGKYMVFYQGLPPKKQKKMVRFLQNADLVVALSDDWKTQFEQAFSLTNCVTVHNGVDTVRFQQACCDMNPVANQFLFLGRLSEAKGIYDLIDAVALVKEQNVQLKCVLAGVGDTEQVNALIAQKGLAEYFELVGWVDDAKKMQCLSQVGTLVLPSHGEALPMAILEAMAAGKAIISTTVGAIPEVVAAENGILLEPKDTDALARAMISCVQDVAFLTQASQVNMQKIEQSFSQQAMHTQLKGYMQQLLLG